MMLELIAMLGGGAMRLMPEILKLFTVKADNAHELAMMDKQYALAQLNAQTAGAQQAAQIDSAEVVAMLAAQSAALTGQMQRTGFAWVDALNFLVRPLTTYYFLGCYGLVKSAMIITAISGPNPWVAIVQCWSEHDASILSGILAFWFVGRVFDKQK
jgi:hypothetical protein